MPSDKAQRRLLAGVILVLGLFTAAGGLLGLLAGSAGALLFGLLNLLVGLGMVAGAYGIKLRMRYGFYLSVLTLLAATLLGVAPIFTSGGGGGLGVLAYAVTLGYLVLSARLLESSGEERPDATEVDPHDVRR